MVGFDWVDCCCCCVSEGFGRERRREGRVCDGNCAPSHLRANFRRSEHLYDEASSRRCSELADLAFRRRRRFPSLKLNNITQRTINVCNLGWSKQRAAELCGHSKKHVRGRVPVDRQETAEANRLRGCRRDHALREDRRLRLGEFRHLRTRDVVGVGDQEPVSFLSPPMSPPSA